VLRRAGWNTLAYHAPIITLGDWGFVLASERAPSPPTQVPAGTRKFQVFAQDFGRYPALKGFAYFLSTLLLLMGVQSMYQKFYSAKSPAEAKKAVAIWIVGTIVVETIVIAIAVYASVYNTERALGWDGRALVLNAARYMVPGPVGVLLLGAACAVVLSTGMNYLLSSSSNVMRDIYQGMINPNADPTKMVALQKVFIVVMGLCAFLMIFVPTYLKSQISILHTPSRTRWRRGDAGAARGADRRRAPGRAASPDRAARWRRCSSSCCRDGAYARRGVGGSDYWKDPWGSRASTRSPHLDGLLVLVSLAPRRRDRGPRAAAWEGGRAQRRQMQNAERAAGRQRCGTYPAAARRLGRRRNPPSPSP
jgi:hypothetical protein